MDDQSRILEQAAAITPPTWVAEHSGYPGAMDKAWRYVGLLKYPKANFTGAMLIPHHHNRAAIWAKEEAAPSVTPLCKVTLQLAANGASQNILIGRCEQTGDLFWAKILLY